jgi:hypothetical protein
MLFLGTSLVEQNDELGVFAEGSEATVEASVVRGTPADAQGLGGRGISVRPAETTGVPSTLFLRASLVEQSSRAGVFVEGSAANIEASVVRDTRPDAQGLHGRGVNVQPHPTTTSVPSMLVMRASVVEHSHELGVFISGSQATVEASVVRDTLPNALGLGGHGVHVMAEPLGTPTTLVLRAALIEQSSEAAVAVNASVATVEACLLRNTIASPGFGAGEGVIVISQPSDASATIARTRIHQSALAAISAWGAHVAIGDSALSCQTVDLNSETFQGKTAELEDRGGNTCGCPEATGSCKALSAGLQPPQPLAPASE